MEREVPGATGDPSLPAPHGVSDTGSSGVQSIPVIARGAERLYAFERTPQYTVPARHHTVDKSVLDEFKGDYEAI